MDSFKKKFIEEANDHIDDLEVALLDLEKDIENKGLIERIFRAMHSLKGGGAMFGYEKISEFTHNLETIYDYIRNGEIEITKEILNITLLSVDHLKLLLESDEELSEEMTVNHEGLQNQIMDIIDRISGKTVKNKTEIQATPSGKDEIENESTYHISFIPNSDIFDNGTNPLYLIDELAGMGDCVAIPNYAKIPAFSELKPLKCYVYWEIILATSEDLNNINDVFIFVEDECKLEINKISEQNLLKNKKFNAYLKDNIKNNVEPSIDELKVFIEQIEKSVSNKVKKVIEDRSKITTKDNTISSIRVASEKLDTLMNLVSELVTTQARLSLFAEQDDRPELTNIAENVQKLSRQLRDNAFSIVLIPIENMITRFQRLVRDLSNELNKDVQFIAEGTDTELDKTIIENLTDPLLHIIRNSIDHGIEPPEQRRKAEKPVTGKILLKAYYSGANVHIEISDDGAGIDAEFIKQRAISKGIIAQDINLSKKEILDLIFLPGFSTAKNITDVSGRGVGMDVVKRKIASIRGEVEVNSELGKGTTITIMLPLTLSIIDGLLVKIEKTFYIIPLTSVHKIYAVKHGDVYGKFNNVIVLDGEQIPFYNLREEFKLNENKEDNEEMVVIKYDDKRIGFTVDNVVGEYQAVLKPLGKHYKNQEIISGATILGDGTIALVMDTNKAIKHFSKQTIITEDMK